MYKAVFPQEFNLFFKFDPSEGQYVVSGDILEEWFPEEFFAADSLWQLLEDLAEAFSEIEIDE